MSLVSLNIGQYGFNYVPGWGPDSGWLATWGELDFTPDTDATYRHYWALQRISPFLMDEGTAGIDVTTSIPLAVSGNPVRIADSREFLHQSAMYKLSPIFREGDLLPYIVTHPSDTTSINYGSVCFSVEDLGGDTYQWQRDGTDIADATEATYCTMGLDSSGDYRVQVCNSEGCIYSDSAHLSSQVTDYAMLSGGRMEFGVFSWEDPGLVFDSEQSTVVVHSNDIMVIDMDISSAGPTVIMSSSVGIYTDPGPHYYNIQAHLVAPIINVNASTLSETIRAVPTVSIPVISDTDWTGYRNQAIANSEYYADSTKIGGDYSSSGGVSFFNSSSSIDGTGTVLFTGSIISDDVITVMDGTRHIESTGYAIAALAIDFQGYRTKVDTTGILYAKESIGDFRGGYVNGQMIAGAAMRAPWYKMYYRPLL